MNSDDLPRQKPLVNDVVGGTPLVVLHQSGTLSALDGAVIAASRHVCAVAAFDRSVDDNVLTFSLRGEQFIDDQTSSTWDILGRATAVACSEATVVRQPSAAAG